MEDTEDLSARVLLRHIFNTEPSRTPMTRSVSQRVNGPSTATRRSSRLSQRDAAQTPQAILRRSLKHRLSQTMTRKSVPAPQRTSAAVARKDPVSTSALLADGETPRHILTNILQTEPGKSPMAHGGGPSEEQEPPSGASSAGTCPSIELSALELPDVTIDNIISTSKVLSRKRPRRSLNVTAFEKRLRDAEEKSEESLDDQLSLSSSSSTSLSLKTPFADPQTERRGLQRKVSQRRKFSVEEFGAAVNKRQMGDMNSLVSAERDLGETTNTEGVTLGLSKLSEPDLTMDIVNCNTALYPQPDATTSDASIVATQDKPTVTASRLELDIAQDSVMEAEPDENALEDLCPGGEEGIPEKQSDGRVSRSPGGDDKAQEEEAEGAARGEPEAYFESTSEEKGVADSQTDEAANRVEEEEEAAEDDVDAGSQSDEERLVKDVQSEEKEEADEGAASSTSQEDAKEADPETEDDGDLPEDKLDSQSQDNVEMESQEDENVTEPAEEEEEDGEADQHEHRFEEDGAQIEDGLDGEDEEWRQPAAEHISRRSRHSQAALVVLDTESGEDMIDGEAAGLSSADSKAHPASDLQSNVEIEVPSAENPDRAESLNPEQSEPRCADEQPGAQNENSLHTGDAGEQLSGVSPEDAGPEGADEQEEWEEEEEEDDDYDECEDLPSETPAFVKEKINFSYPGPSASPALKNLQTTASAASEAKPKQARQRRRGPAKKKGTLPKSYLMSVFRHFAKTKVSGEVYPVLDEVVDSFFERLARDLETYAAHAGRKTIEVEDTILLLKRQGYVNDKVPVEVLIEKYLRLEQRELLIPIATSGNVVIPKRK
ncbi:centromere protein T isoform X2 [Salarias fasciatus]|uniref:centromere protein T isoform X2 n=1 Tax=Salarias fasciatus TaxID=181472 RepID=UPI001176F5E1|nr:centromere protein T isoform X2 [Salarias fasciatus]